MAIFGNTMTPEQKAAKQAAKDRLKAQRRREAAERAVAAEQLRKERYEAMPHFVVRETREVTVKAESMNDAIALASAAFKEGQDEDDWSIKWRKPWGVEGDTIDEIRTVNIKASEVDD